MDTQIKRRNRAAREAAATNDRNFRTFLLVAQMEAQAIGARIAQARKECGMTQEDVAEVATFSRRSLQDYEAGTTIPYKHLREISALFSRPVGWFLHGDEDGSDDSTEGLLRQIVQEETDAIRESLRRIEQLLDERDRE